MNGTQLEDSSTQPVDSGTLSVEDQRKPPEGWICPRCQKVHAPWVEHCDCEPQQDSASVGPSEFK